MRKIGKVDTTDMEEFMNQIQIRTDLALETQEKFKEDQVEIKGVKVEEEFVKESEIKITKVFIETENGAKIMGKPKGRYITLESPHMNEEDLGSHEKISKQIAEIMKEMLPKKQGEISVLVVGLGNREVTPDALGPRVVDHMMITRHILKEFGAYAFGKKEENIISGIAPGVMAQTGMESLEIIKGVVKQTNPDCIIVIDALAARNSRRLARTIQITDTGINPGSGVGNHRHGFHEESLGIPVIAIGIPTVVDAATIVSDTMSNLIQAMNKHSDLKNVGNALETLSEAESHDLIRELLSPNLNTMFVTPKDIDESVKRLSFMISEGLNMALIK